MRELRPCSVEGCARHYGEPASGRGYCPKHYLRWKRHGDVTRGRDHSGSRNPAWKGEAAGYEAAHQRVRSTRGRAPEHACAYCSQPALQWAYDHADAAERTTVRQGRLVAYSTDPSHYIAFCRPCHLRLDERRLELISA